MIKSPLKQWGFYSQNFYEIEISNFSNKLNYLNETPVLSRLINKKKADDNSSAFLVLSQCILSYVKALHFALIIQQRLLL